MPIYTITTEGAETLVSATAETLLQIRGVATSGYGGAEITEWGVSFNGVTATDPPIRVELMFQTTDGTSDTAATEVNISANSSAAAMTTGHHSFSAEPTSGGIMFAQFVHPQGGGIIKEYPPGREPEITNATTSRIGIKVTPGTLTGTVTAVAYLSFEE